MRPLLLFQNCFQFITHNFWVVLYIVCFTSFCVFVYKCVLYCCHRVATQLQLKSTEWPKKCIHSLLICVYTLKDISASQERLCHLLSKNYKSACAICWENIILHSHPEIEISFKFIPKILMSKECIHFLGHSVFVWKNKGIYQKSRSG